MQDRIFLKEKGIESFIGRMLISMEYRLRRKGSDISWKIARDILSTHQCQTVMMTNKKVKSFM